MAIRLYWSGGNRDEVNYGDSISPLIVRHLSGKDVEYADVKRCDMAAIGSLLDKVITRAWKRPFHLRFDKVRIWGTGSFGPDALKGKKSLLNIAAVRGPLTRDALGLDAGTPLGDPGLLINLLDVKTEKKYRWGIIPHVVDRKNSVVQALAANKSTCVIDLGDPDLLATARQINACDFILSTSLHGLITADAFNVPNVWLRVSDGVFGGDWKFMDYFASVGRGDKAPLLPSPALDLQKLEETATRVDARQVDARQKDLLAAFKALNL